MTIILTRNELDDIAVRVKSVQGFMKQSTAAWLSIAREIYKAKNNLKEHAFEKFIEDVRLTKTIAEKLTQVGKCNALYHKPDLDLITSVDGWTVLYELSKLDTKRLTSLFTKLRAGPTIKLTRKVVVDHASGKSSSGKCFVIASIEIDEKELKRLSDQQFKQVEKHVTELKYKINNGDTGFEMKERTKAIQEIEKRTAANSNSTITATAA